MLPLIGPDWLDPQVLLEALGAFALIGVLAIVFAECGLLIGFFLPGDSLLFAAGLLVATGFIDTPIAVVCVLISVAAILGNVSGYWIGYRFGPALFQRPDSRLFKQEYVERTREFFDRYGGRAIVLARFVPIVRTFITAMAGTARMPFRPYLLWSVVGGILWGTGVTLLGYWLGNVQFVEDNIELILIGFVILSVVPIFVELRRQRGRAPVGDAETAD
ncbi:MAG: VTT domain-containing protein [Actinomycetia bacterium]|jgi:membrane-associated protein|nr:VTT domain-containing protein [Actinomycetes bacterium]